MLAATRRRLTARRVQDDETDDTIDREAQLETFSRERRKILALIEDAELRIESLNSKLVIGNYEGARRQQAPAKADAVVRQTPVPQGPFGVNASMLNDRATQLRRASQMKHRRRSTLMRPNFAGTTELARLLTKRQTDAEQPRAPPGQPARPDGAPGRFRRGGRGGPGRRPVRRTRV